MNRLNIKFESPLPHRPKPVPVTGFYNYKKNFVKTLPSLYYYRKPRLVKSKSGWYIEYYYRIPVNVRPLYDGKEWLRIRVREDLNRRRGSEKEDYAEWLLLETSNSLRNGFNPFEMETEHVEQQSAAIEEKQQLNITDALQLFLEKWKTRALEPLSYSKYERYLTRLIDWLKLKHIPYADVTTITQNHIEQFLTDMKRIHGFSNREYNNHFDFIRTAFNFLLKKKYITESPCADFEKQKVKVTKHRFFDAKSLTDITRALQVKDSYLHLVFQTVYYTCIRSDKEIRNLKVGGIDWDHGTILVEVSKTDQDYVPLDKYITPLLKEYIKDAPADYYIFGPRGKPSSIAASHGLFSKKFQKIRDQIGMSDKYTMYGAKHTRIVHLKQSGATDADIMSLTRHKSFEAYAHYLRDIGLTADIKKLNKLSRKI